MAIIIQPRELAGGPTASIIRMRIVSTARKHNVIRPISREAFLEFPAGKNGVFAFVYGFNDDATNFIAVADTVQMQHIIAEKDDKRLRLYFVAHLDFFAAKSLELPDSTIAILRKRVYTDLS